jgi:hypothetical protein
VTFCFTPEHLGIQAHHTSPPVNLDGYAEFCARMVRRYAPPAPQMNAGSDATLEQIVISTGI